MKHILLRARKDPFEIASPERTIDENLIGDNAGNLVFTTAAYRTLATADTTVSVDRSIPGARAADRINERYDAYVIPLANAFRISFEPSLIRLTRLIRRLRIPVVVLGVGAQAGIDNDPARLGRIEGSVRDFVSAVLDRSPSIGVRGDFTRDYLHGLGFRDIDVIGCPSMFIHGDQLRVEKRMPSLAPEAPLAINVSPYVKAMGPVVMQHVASHPGLIYIPQDLATLERLVWGEPGGATDAADPRPIHLTHPLFRDDKVRFFIDPWPWFQELARVDFSFGTRIHGNIAALIAGTPAFVLAHDSRTLELVRYHDIPYRLMRDLRPDTDAAELYAEADYGPLNRGHAARFATYVAYLDRHGLDHIHRSPSPVPDFDTRMTATEFPPAIRAATGTSSHQLADRLRWRRTRLRRGLRDRALHLRRGPAAGGGGRAG